MANYFFTETAKFKPFTYQEMLAPIVAYKEAYDTNETVLNTLLEDAATKGFNFRTNDTKEKAAYDSMIDRIKNAANSMATQGLNNQVFNEIRSINKDYRTTMIPIQKKLAKRQELIDEQRKLKASNQNLLFTKDYETASLDDITGDSTYDIVDLGKIIEDSVTDFTKFIASKGAKQGTPKQIKGTNSYMVETGYGYKEDDWNKDITNPESELYKQVNSYINDPRLNNLPAKVKEQAKAKIQDAIYSNKGVFEQQIIKDTSKNDTPSWDWLSTTKDEQGNITGGTILTRSGKLIDVSQDANGKMSYNEISNSKSSSSKQTGFPTGKVEFKYDSKSGRLKQLTSSLKDAEKVEHTYTLTQTEDKPSSWEFDTVDKIPNVDVESLIPDAYKSFKYEIVKRNNDYYVRILSTQNEENNEGSEPNPYNNNEFFGQ